MGRIESLVEGKKGRRSLFPYSTKRKKKDRREITSLSRMPAALGEKKEISARLPPSTSFPSPLRFQKKKKRHDEDRARVLKMFLEGNPLREEKGRGGGHHIPTLKTFLAAIREKERGRGGKSAWSTPNRPKAPF